ncbi:nitroreductase family protein [Marinobacter sp. M216]|uniref:Putative NAD(P)H nitroreductase n=1 Tax=Marinobacter albus TaxID=3030833 RepID=A0ABT7HCP9_9GAMM|nr:MULTISPECIES: nitroreductase family protein [unclassified Marinobacter]MBW7469582.1 nitroreductase family protein [Marinobacter sp. F4218]MDK9558149.1 nitroreductase family protein [Marinobacter sp. M216]
MTAVSEFLLNRASEPRLESPAPDSDTLARAFACAARAPDHALLRPWRYLIIQGEGLNALGDLFASTCANNSDEQEIDKLRRAPLRAPMVIVGIASPKVHPKVPEVEQIMSAAAGMSFLELALQDAGFGVMWRTGSVAYHTAVHDGLGLTEEESIVGFLYVGTVSSEKPRVPRPEMHDYVQNWPS